MTAIVSLDPTETFSVLEQGPFSLPPFESFLGVGSNAVSGTSCLVLASFSSSENHLFHIDVEANALDPALQVRAGSLDTPADATGALAVGAIRAANPDTVLVDELEPFSSSGPTDDGRPKPEICGPDNTLSHQSGLNPFSGTSSATPHVAGAAALMLDQNPSLTVDQLRNKLINEARTGAFSVNNQCGGNSGAVSLQAAVPTFCIPPLSDNWIITSSCTLSISSTAPANVIVQNNSVLTIPSGLSLDIDFVNNFLRVEFGSGVLIKSGGAVT